MNSIDFNDPELKELESFAQMLPKELLETLQQSAKSKNISLDHEIAARILLTFIRPENFGLNSQFQKILAQKTSAKQAELECAHRRNAWLCLYEMEKIFLFAEFEDKLPKNYKEQFSLIPIEEINARLDALRTKRRKRNN